MSAPGRSAAETEPLASLIGALGGEGGGVLTDWLVAAAMDMDFPVQSTSIPGVAQRTGATTYYLEIYPVPWAALGGQRPVLALHPSPGRVDIVVASELLEAGRSMENGYVSPERTTLVASTHRIYAIGEKSAMGDGRFDTERIPEAAQAMARRALLADMSRTARATDSVLNAVLLGSVVGCGVLPIPAEVFERSIRRRGVGVESNLRGFAAGVALAQGQGAALQAEAPPQRAARTLPAELARQIEEAFPEAVREIVGQGAARLADYQDRAYACDFLRRLAPILAADEAQGGRHRGYELTRETTRYLALWMSYEDAIRVADLKTRAARMAGVALDAGAKPGEPVRITEYLDPGLEEICAILPGFLARPLLRLAARHPALARFRRPLRVRTDTVSGFLQLWLMARLRRLRRFSYRYGDEQALIGVWLAAVQQAAEHHYGFAEQVTQCARLIKGYGETYTRGRGNFEAILAALVRPVLESRRPADVETLRRAREAALTDPEGVNLDKVLGGATAADAPARPSSA